MVALTAQANSGTITFAGKITASTCTVVVDGQGADATITLPTVSKDLLKADGDTAGKTHFNIVMSKCTLGGTPADTKVSTYFEAGSTVDVSTGFLINSGSATKVALRLTDGTTNAAIKAGSESQTSNNTFATAAGASGAATASLPYAVEYIASGASTAGTVASSVTYNIMYK